MRIKKTSQTTTLPAQVVNTRSDSTEDTYACDYANKAFGGTILWTNDSPTSDFAGQTINKNLSSYDYIDIVSNSGIYRCPTTGYSINMIRMQDSNGNYTGSWFIDMRLVQVNPTEIIFQDNRGSATNITNSYVVRNNHNKPLYIIGYKTGLFPTQQSNRSLNTYSGDIEEKKDIVIDDGEEETPIDDGNKK